MGARTLLPATMNAASPSQVDRIFGAEFYADLDDISDNVWAGPVRSGYGLHLILVIGREPTALPELAEIRDKVLKD